MYIQINRENDRRLAKLLQLHNHKTRSHGIFLSHAFNFFSIYSIYYHGIRNMI